MYFCNDYLLHYVRAANVWKKRIKLYDAGFQTIIRPKSRVWAKFLSK